MMVFLIILLPKVFGYFPDETDCRNSTIGKRPGHAYWSYNHIISTEPDFIFNNTDSTNCSLKCINDLQCQVADYNKKTKECKIYFNITSPKYDFEIQNDLFYWKFCDLANGIDNKELANGYWFYDINVQFETDESISHFTGAFETCRIHCRLNPLCGGFNYHDQYRICQPLVIWDGKISMIKYVDGWRGYYWVLQNPITYKVQDEYCRNIKTKHCFGKWKIQKSVTITNNYRMITFRTRNFTKCYSACEFYPNCVKVIFQYSTSTCILQGTLNTKCAKNIPIPKKEIVILEWECCEHEFGILSSFEHTLASPFRKCFQIQHPQYMALIPYRCSDIKTDINENCLTRNKIYSIPCYPYQCFQSTGRTLKNYSIVFNGYQTFLIKNATESNFVLTDYNSCELYSGAIPKNPTVSIISPKDWYSIQINESSLSMILPAKRIIVGALVHACCLCFEWLHCVEVIRHFQNNIRRINHINVPYHFIISPSGDIFEGRGWYQQNKMKNIPKNDTYFIAFLGTYYSNNPTIASMHAFKSLINYGILRRYIEEKYYLTTLYDFDRIHFKNNYKRLYNVIRSQPRYRGLGKEKCLQISILTLVLNFVCVVFSSIITIVLSSILYRLCHTKNCKLLKTLNNDEHLLNFILCPVSIYTEGLLIYNKELKSFIKRNYSIMNISNISIFWITEMSERNKCQYCLKKVQQLFIILKKRNQNLEISQLKHINQECEKESICLIFSSHSALLKTVVIIVHLESYDIIFHLKHIISSITNGKCVCSNFNLNFVKIKSKENGFETFIDHEA